MKNIYYITESYLNKLDPDIKRVDVAGAIIFKNMNIDNKAKLLIIKRAKDDHYPNIWEIPRGKVEDKENIKQGLLREVKEEVGFDIIPLQFFNKFSYVVEKNGSIERISTQYNFICKMKNENDKVKLSFEHQDYKWISHDAEAELYLNNEIKKTVMMALNNFGSFVINTGYDYDAKKEKYKENKILENSFFGKNY